VPLLAVSLAMEKFRSLFNAFADVAVPARTTLLVIWKGNYSRFESWVQVVGIVLRGVRAKLSCNCAEASTWPSTTSRCP